MLVVRTWRLEFAAIHGDMYERNVCKERWKTRDEGRKFARFDFLYAEGKVGHTWVVRESNIDTDVMEDTLDLQVKSELS